MANRKPWIVAGLLLVAAVVVWWRLAGHSRAPSGRAAAHGAAGKGSAARSADVDDVAPIGLDRLSQRRVVRESGRVEASRAAAAASELAPTPPGVVQTIAPAPEVRPEGTTGVESAPGSSLPPLNVKFIGKVEARKGVWVAALLTDNNELLVGKEGDVVGNRLRIVNIGLESVDLVEVPTARQRRVRLSGGGRTGARR